MVHNREGRFCPRTYCWQKNSLGSEWEVLFQRSSLCTCGEVETGSVTLSTVEPRIAKLGGTNPGLNMRYVKQCFLNGADTAFHLMHAEKAMTIG